MNTPGVYPVTLEVTSSSGRTDTVELQVHADNDPPVPVIDTPDASLTWSVGDPIAFSGHATDSQDAAGAITLRWTIVMEHCPAGCHEHTIETRGRSVRVLRRT